MASLSQINIRFNADLEQFSTQMDNANRSMQKFGKKMKKTGAALTVGLTAPIVALGTKSFNVFADFEDQLAKVEAISGATSVEFKKLRQNAEDLGSATRFTASEVAQLQLNLSKLGFDPTEILQSTAGILDLALATGEDLASSATVAASTIRGFGLDASQTQRVVDVMAKSFSSSALDLEKFKTAMAVVGPVANTAGASIEDATGMLAVLVNAGIDASTAGTGLRNIFLDTAKAGITLEDAFDKIVNSTNQNATAMDLFGKRGATVATVLAKNYKEAQNFATEFDNAGGAAKAMADIMDDTAKGSLARLKSAMESAFIAIGDELSPSIRSLADNLAGLISRFKDLSPQTKKIIVIISALAASVGPVLVAIGFLATNIIPGLISALAALKVAIASNPIGLLATVLAATAGAALVANSRFTALTNATKEYSDITAKAADNIADEKVQLDTLLRTARNEKLSKEERIKAINKLNEIVPQYNKELSLETVNTDKAKAATDKYVQSLLLKAKVQAAQEKLVEVERELLNLQLGTNAAAQPSLWQNLANGFTAAGNAGAFVSKTAKDVVANLSEEEKQLNLLQEKIVSFLSENKEVAAQFNEQTTAIQNTNTALEGYRAKVESVNSIEPEGAKKMATAIGEIGVMARGVVAPLTAAQTKALEVAQSLNEQVGPLVESAVETLTAGFGRLIAGFANGTAGIRDVANLIFSTLGDLMIKLGETAIQTAIGIGAIQAAFKSLNPAIAAAAGIALIAFGTLIKSSLASAPGEVALANGGVVFGETLSIIGDNRNAAFDPEVVSPLSKLKEFISPGDGGGSGKVELSGEFKINGKDLALALDRTNQRRVS